MLSVLPRPLLERLGIEAVYTQKARVFGGAVLERQVGVALFTYNGATGGVSVLFGEEDDQQVLGVTALEVMGLRVDPRSGELEHTDILMLPITS